MNRIIRNTFILLAPLTILLLSFLVFDPFSIVHSKKKSFKSRNQCASDVVNMKSFIKNDLIDTKALILSNSKGHAFLTESLSMCLGGKKVVSLSCPGENLSYIKNRLEYITRNSNGLENVLLVLDDLIINNKDGDLLRGPGYIHHPISNGKSWLGVVGEGFSYYVDDFYFLKYFNVLFSNSCSYDSFISLYKEEINIKTKDLYFEEKRDNIDFGSGIDLKFKVGLEKEDLELLEKISKICKKEKIGIKVVFGPYYWSNKINEEVVEVFQNYFGKKNVFDFTGATKFSEKENYWIDKHHYNTEVGRQILSKMYSSGN